MKRPKLSILNFFMISLLLFTNWSSWSSSVKRLLPNATIGDGSGRVTVMDSASFEQNVAFKKKFSVNMPSDGNRPGNLLVTTNEPAMRIWSRQAASVTDDWSGIVFSVADNTVAYNSTAWEKAGVLFQDDASGWGRANIIFATSDGNNNWNVNPTMEKAAILSSGHFRLVELSTDPSTSQLPDITGTGKIAFYVKNNKFVIAYNNAGTMRYLTVPLDGTTTTWTQSTTAP